MTAELSRGGIGITTDTVWGLHGCLFYETQQDLLDAVVPFLKSGLEHGEFCLWIISDSLREEEAVGALRRSVPGLERHLSEQNIELIPYTAWYLEGGSFDSHRCTERLLDKFQKALATGHHGLRITGDLSWLDKPSAARFRDYENQAKHYLAGKPVLALCTYPIGQSTAADLIDAGRAHHVCTVVRNGDWEIVDTPELKEAKAEIKKLNLHLEQRIVDRTLGLRAAIEELKKEIDERVKVEAELRRQKEVLQKVFDHIPVMINFMGSGQHIQLVNSEWERVLGWTLEEIRAQNVDIVAACYPDPRDQQQVREFISNPVAEWREFRTRVRDGRVIDTSWANVRLSDGTNIGFGRDITERKQALLELEATTRQLRSLSASILAGREEERTRVARLIHDELGSAFTSLKWDLASLDKAISKPLDPATLAALRAKLGAMMSLADRTLNEVRRIAWELRPSLLDDLGLLDAIEWQAQQFEARTGIVCQRSGFADEVHFNPEQSTAIFRILQEALTNIIRHAHATRVEISMAQEEGEFVLTVADNGRGVTGIEKSGLGILGMQERARLVGGSIEIRGLEGAGTRIAVRVPVAGNEPRPPMEIPATE